MDIAAWVIVLRSAVTFTLLMSLILTIIVMFKHRKAYKLAPRINGLLPRYSALMAGGVFVLEFALAWALGESLRSSNPFTATIVWRTSMYGVGSFCILVGLMIIRRIEVIRIQHAPITKAVIERLDKTDHQALVREGRDEERERVDDV